ncbi:hypothetical protein V6N11_044245 [Hibiscus sabdariffa]|uniref:Uncharacterized protein n=1 Tax=Hibiscus sabdariffa TaxID=183260 RepID=A0ABR2RF02_9ROSI
MPAEEEEILDEDDFDILEGNVKRSVVDGIINIGFSIRVKDLAVKSLDRTIFAKLLGRRIGYNTLGAMDHIWKLPYRRALVLRLLDRSAASKEICRLDSITRLANDVRDQAASGDVVAPPQTTPLISKGKKPVPQTAKTPKHKSATSICKPITVVHNASKQRLASHASSSRSIPTIPHISKPSNRANHSVVVISENDEPSMATPHMQHNPMQHDIIPYQAIYRF